MVSRCKFLNDQHGVRRLTTRVPNTKCECTLSEPACTPGDQFFSFGEAEGCWIFWNFWSFSLSSHHVPQIPNVFCNIFPIIPHFMSYPLALNFTLVTSISNPKGRDCNINILGLSKAWSFFPVMGQSLIIKGKKQVELLRVLNSFFPLAQVYRWKEENICQSIWDKSEVLWRTWKKEFDTIFGLDY